MTFFADDQPTMGISNESFESLVWNREKFPSRKRSIFTFNKDFHEWYEWGGDESLAKIIFAIMEDDEKKGNTNTMKMRYTSTVFINDEDGDCVPGDEKKVIFELTMESKPSLEDIKKLLKYENGIPGANIVHFS